MNDILYNLFSEAAIMIISVLLTSVFVLASRRLNIVRAVIKFLGIELSLAKEPSAQVNFSKRLEELTKNLASASEEFDNVLEEMKQVASDRKTALNTLETQIAELSTRETEMKNKINELEKVSIPAIEYFLQATEKSDKRSAKRDYLLFIAGVVVSAIVSLIFRFTLGI